VNRDGILKAAYFACIAIGEETSVRNVVGMVRKISGKGVRTQDALRWLDAFKRETVGNRSGNGRETLTTLKTANRETPRKRAGNLRAGVVKVLELQTSFIADAHAPAVEHTPPALPDGLPREFPQDVNALKRLTIPFLAAFGNAKSDEAIRKHGPAYADVLAAFRSRGVSVSQAWSAFADALAAHSGKPLFSNLANTALRYLPARPAGSRFDPPAGKPIRTLNVDELD
jgi:hypothetical protein